MRNQKSRRIKDVAIKASYYYKFGLMNRKHFISSIIPLASVASAAKGDISFWQPDHKNKIPPYLRNGDTIGITLPSGFITIEEIQPAIKKMQEWGFECV